MSNTPTRDGTAAMITVRGLRKAYGKQTVLAGIDLTISSGEIFALLGPNGAGKTTTVNIATTLVKPDAGEVRIAGIDVLRAPRLAREAFALTGQYASVDAFQTGEENLRMMARLAGLSTSAARIRAAELLERFELTEAARKRAASYSGGMRRRLDLAISLIAAPPVIFLDEPTTGLDPRSRAQMWDVVAELAAGGTTILLTTQYLEEADRLSDRLAVLDDGRVIAEGTVEQLKGRIDGQHIEFTFDDARQLAAVSEIGFEGLTIDTETLTARVPSKDPVPTMRAFLAVAAERRIEIADISIVKPTLDDVFLTITGRGSGHENGTTDDGERAGDKEADKEEVAA